MKRELLIKNRKVFISLLILVIFLTACHSYYKLPKSKPESEIKQEKIDKKVRKKINKNEYYLKKLQTNRYDTPFTKRYIAKTAVGKFDIAGTRGDGRLKDGISTDGFVLYYTYHNTTNKKHRLQTSIFNILSIKQAKFPSVFIKENNKGKFVKDFLMYHGIDSEAYEQDQYRHLNGNKYVNPGESADGAIGYFVKTKEEEINKHFHEKPEVTFEIKADPISTAKLGKMNFSIPQYFD